MIHSLCFIQTETDFVDPYMNASDVCTPFSLCRHCMLKWKSQAVGGSNTTK